jgi:tRNA-2-methylthio-N6-dimethylallyladenosine synthase
VGVGKKLFLQTYGCQMNYHDSERVQGMLAVEGYEPAAGFEDADVVLINTCAVRERPERKLFGELGRLKKQKEKNPHLVIGVIGCMAPRDADVIRSRAPHVDILVGPRSLHRIVGLVEKARIRNESVEEIDLFDDPTPATAIRRSSAVTAWVDVLFGCSFACSFCAVPSARGREVSRNPGEILEEIEHLASVGYREVTLLGQTVNAYGRDFSYKLDNYEDASGDPIRIDFAWLLRQINDRAPGLRVRFTSPHPQLFSDRLIDTIAELPTVCEHVHLPLQSADDEVLRRMKRSYTYEKYVGILEKLRSRIPEVSITTDIIVAFPGETEEQFQKTLKAYEDLQFDQAFMFAYSPRRHTKALDFAEEEIPKEVGKERLNRLIQKANQIAKEKNQSQVGREFEVLVEGPSDKNPDRLAGRTRTNKIMVFEGSPEHTGKCISVRAEKAFLWGFQGVHLGNGNEQ